MRIKVETGNMAYKDITKLAKCSCMTDKSWLLQIRFKQKPEANRQDVGQD